MQSDVPATMPERNIQLSPTRSVDTFSENSDEDDVFESKPRDPSVSTIEETPNIARPSMDRSLLEASLAISGNVDQNVSQIADEMFVKTNEAFDDKIAKMEQHLSQDLQIQLNAIKNKQNEAYKEVTEQLTVLEGVNKQAQDLADGLKKKEGQYKDLEGDYAGALSENEKNQKRLIAQKSKLVQLVNDRDAEIVDLKNKLAALETERLQGEMDQQQRDARQKREEKLAKEQQERVQREQRRNMETLERRVEEEEQEKDEWRKLYETVLKKYKKKIESDLETRKKEIERGAEMQRIMAEQVQEIEKVKNELSQNQKLSQEQKERMEEEIQKLRDRLKEEEERNDVRIKELEGMIEELDGKNKALEKMLGGKNQEIGELQLKIEELLKQIEEMGEREETERKDREKEAKTQKEEIERLKREMEKGGGEEPKGEGGEKKEEEKEGKEEEKPERFKELMDRIKALSDALEKAQKEGSDEKKRREGVEAELEQEKERSKMLPKVTEQRDVLQKKQQKSESEIVALNAKIIELTKKLAEKNKQLDVSNRYVFNLKQKLEMQGVVQKISTSKKLQSRESLISEMPHTSTAPVKKKSGYRAQDPTDEVDRKFSEVLNMTDCPVPISRVGKGVYMFGNRRITATMQGGRLVIRVGGGFMVVQEFIRTYGQQEAYKMEVLEKKRDEMSRNNSGVFDQANMSRQGSKEGLGLTGMKSKASVPKINFDPAKRRQSAMVTGGFQSFQSPPKTDRSSFQKKHAGETLKRRGSSDNLKTFPSSKSREDLKIKAHLIGDKMKKVPEDDGYSDMSYRSLRMQKNSLMDPSLAQSMIASLAEDESPRKEERKKTKVDVGLNGSLRVRDFNKAEKEMIMKMSGKGSKKAKDKALQKVSKSMMVHERKFSTSKDVEDFSTYYEEND